MQSSRLAARSFLLFLSLQPAAGSIQYYLRRRRVVRLNAIRGVIGMLAEEFDPLLLESRVVPRGFDEIHEAANRIRKPLLQHVISKTAVVGKGLVRLSEREHVRIYARAQVLEWDPQRP